MPLQLFFLLHCSLFRLAAASRVDFQDLATTNVYRVPQQFTSSNVFCVTEPFFFDSGTSTTNGSARISTNGVSNPGTNVQFLWIGNINIRMEVGAVTALSTSYGAYGGNLNLCVNHAFTNFFSIPALHGATLGGVNLAVITNSLTRGRLILSGLITNFAIGGQEFALADVDFTPVELPVLDSGLYRDASNHWHLSFRYSGTNTASFSLESTPSFSPPTWVTLTGTVFTVDSPDHFCATTPASPGFTNSFYRVRKTLP